METSLEPAATKRGCETEGKEAAGRKKTAGVVRTAKPDMSWVLRSFNYLEEARLKHAVARLNKENPDAPAIVLDELTEEQRADLLRKHKEWVTKMEEVLEVQREADRQANISERARAPPPPQYPSKDQWELDYEFERNHLERKLAREPRFAGFSFEDKTRIPAMCFTDNPMRDHTKIMSTLQVFSVKVAGLDGGLMLPLTFLVWSPCATNWISVATLSSDVQGTTAKTLTEQDPYLVLTGPSRAVFYRDKVYLEAVLKVKGTTESEDTDLSLLFERFVCCEKMNLCADFGKCRRCSCVSSGLYRSKLSTMEFTCGLVASSVEATIGMQVVEGLWSKGLRCKITACIGSLGHMDAVLLDSGEEKVPVAPADGTVELLRRVVSVESYGQLIVRSKMCQGGQVLTESKASFAPSDAGRSQSLLDLGVCKLKITVAWSRILLHHPAGGLPLTCGTGEAVSSGSSS